MVKNAASLGRSGTHDFILLRGAAIVILLYVLYMVGFFVCHSSVTYPVWQGFFAMTFTKVFTLLALLSVLVHAWIGLWQVLSDYIKPYCWRMLLQFVIVIVLLVYLLSGLAVLWSV
ncbi:succinate dehydrogenase, hydrophobic membrane anchor protein [Dongshaea marina]|uniref:succinate dehydrogenase, hydrophobic membrane anchor protein n=1 Tax=Dongshaea marina TaxID=2047966 RepID=UPI000D3E9013|nr:succinate dehydrogenase, hydrophobic membrane anchor protein [Dongshaea marina]